MARAALAVGVAAVVSLMLLVVAEQVHLVEQQQRLSDLARREGAAVRLRKRLRLAVETLACPRRVAREARLLGMRPAPRHVFVDLAAWERGRQAVAVKTAPTSGLHDL